jgi:hypothetical protein
VILGGIEVDSFALLYPVFESTLEFQLPQLVFALDKE